MTLPANAQFYSNMLRQVFLAFHLLAFGALIVKCRTELVNRKLSKDVNCKTASKFSEFDVSICNDGSPKGQEPRKVQSMNNDTRYLDGNGVEEGRRKKKDYGKLFMYLIGAAKATMLYIMIHAVAALAGKALIIAKFALAIATAAILNKALEHNGKTSYEIVKHPHHSYVQTHSSSIDYDHHGGYESGYSYRKRRRIV
ncbi:uncharacterized protein LOC124946991 [Vespa velutina]|uniref:uncharacterized protein LOC124946991 n=1 Tax=Vespa velutina TaxID=202808 RepID=UPI001FB23FAB|nr:uncharacterized protein LOC124946991 [Vespa velutina]